MAIPAVADTPRALQPLPPWWVAHELRRDLIARPNLIRAVRWIAEARTLAHRDWRAGIVESQIAGAFGRLELLRLGEVIAELTRKRIWGGVVPAPPSHLLETSAPTVPRGRVALAAAALDLRLLAVLPATPSSSSDDPPDKRLAAATNYSRELIRQAIRATRLAISTEAPRTRHPRRRTPTGSASSERATQRRRDAAAARKRHQRAGVRPVLLRADGLSAWDRATDEQRAAAVEREELRHRLYAERDAQFAVGEGDWGPRTLAIDAHVMDWAPSELYPDSPELAEIERQLRIIKD